jgi:hypothetical protein
MGTTQTIDAFRFVETLDLDVLLAEAAELTRRREAVLVLLRAVRARQRGRPVSRPAVSREEAANE